MITSGDILNYILLTKDMEILATAINCKTELFFIDEEVELFEILEDVFLSNQTVISVDLMSNYRLSKEASKFIKDLKPLDSLSVTSEVIDAINALLYTNYLEFLTLNAKRSVGDLAKKSIGTIQEDTYNFIAEVQIALSNSRIKDSNEVIVFGDQYVSSTRARYAKAKLSGDYFVSKFGYDALDVILEGIANNDFINIISYVKGFKTTLMRNISYNTILQARNCLFVTLEMSNDETEAEFQAIHASNRTRFGGGRPVITSKAILSGELSEEAEDFLFNEVIPDMANSDDLGIIKFINPVEGDYSYPDLIADINKTISKMDIHLIVIDYLTMVKAPPHNSREDINEMFKSLRKFALKNKIPVINAVQANRAAYNDMILDEDHRYRPDSASDYNEIERSSTVMISTAQLPEQVNSGELLVDCILSRRSKTSGTSQKYIQSNGRIVELSNSTSGSDTDVEDVLQELNIG